LVLWSLDSNEFLSKSSRAILFGLTTMQIVILSANNVSI
jgi:hypothetical protein